MNPVRIIISTFLCLAASAQALVIRHDTPTLDYENYGRQTQFNASTVIVRSNNAEYGLAGATAIDSRWGVAARHTLRNVENWMSAGNGAKLRGSKWNGSNNQGLASTDVVDIIHYDDDFSRFAAAIDIALCRTSNESSTFRIAPLFGGYDELGRTGSGASGANNRTDGTGASRKDEAAATTNSGRWYEVRWAGKNDIDRVQTQALTSPNNATLILDNDHPSNTSKSRFGGNKAIELEYGSMNGDSGSPIYLTKNGLEGQVAGCLSGGSGSLYGDTTVYVRTRVYNNWISDTVRANPDTRNYRMPEVADQVVNVGDTMSVPTDIRTSEQILTTTYSLINPPDGASVNAAGVISWKPVASQAGRNHSITVQGKEDGVVGKTDSTTFMVTVVGTNSTDFWTWSSAPSNWSGVTVSGGSSYGLGSATYPYLQGNTNNLIYQQITGTLPAYATVAVQIKIADFNQAWSTGGNIEYGFRNSEPTEANAGNSFANSNVASVPNFDSANGLADGLGNTGGNVDYSFTFDTTAARENPWFAVRKNQDGGRFAIDDIKVFYFFVDTDGDNLPDRQETAIGTDPTKVDTDGDGLNDDAELLANTDPLKADTDLDGYSDGYEVNSISSNPLDADDPGGAATLAIGINFVSSGGDGPGIGLAPVANAGAPEVSQINWNNTSPLSGTSGSTSAVATPTAGVLSDSNGAATTATVSFSMPYSWSTANEKFTPFGKLMGGYLDSSGAVNCSATIASIPYPEYDVYVYMGSYGNGRTGKLTDGSTTYSFTTASSSPDEPGAYLLTEDAGEGFPVANYAVFRGRTSSSVTLNYLRGSSNGGIHAIQIVPAGAASAYQTWAQGNEIDPAGNGAPGEDADGDGDNNLLEFALRSSATAPSNPKNGNSKPSLLMGRESGNMTLQYIRSKDADDINIIVKWSDNLSDWYDTGITISQVSENADSKTMKASMPQGSHGALFMRVEVETP